MGIIADSIVAYAQPLLDDTDGSHEQMNKAFEIAQMCWNLAVLPEKEREKRISKLREPLGLSKSEFASFRESVIDPMILRHHKMFSNTA